MFGSIGGAELVLVLVLALLLFGPRKLPQIGRTIGSAMSEFRKATLDFKTSLEREVELDEIKSVGREVRSAVDDVKHLRVARNPLPDAVSAREEEEAAAPEREREPERAPDPAEPDA